MLDAVSVFALQLHLKPRLEPLIPEFVMADLVDRQCIVKLFINLIRWLRTVHVLCLLPPPPLAQLLVPFKRLSPYPVDEVGHQQSEVENALRSKVLRSDCQFRGSTLMCTACCDTFACPALSVASAWWCN
ncbi:hypothetical protein WJX77_002816 [Trebouxia sp. C0004]